MKEASTVKRDEMAQSTDLFSSLPYNVRLKVRPRPLLVGLWDTCPLPNSASSYLAPPTRSFQF
jgi:hypothetical protein